MIITKKVEVFGDLIFVICYVTQTINGGILVVHFKFCISFDQE